MYYIFFIILSFQALSAAVPADISFLVADVKYSKEQGSRVCEIQPGLLSSFLGYNDHIGDIGEDLTTFLLQYHDAFFVVHSNIIFRPLFDSLKKRGWHIAMTRKELPKMGPITGNKSAISSYPALLLGGEIIPGYLAIDGGNRAFWSDKYKMSLFLEGEQVKPRWGLYSKKYSSELVQKIHDEINSDIYVIKPRGGEKGYGVLIVPKEELDETLRLIFEETKSLVRTKDPSYRYWYKDRYKFDTFIVEEYVPSDPVIFKEKPYNGTIRLVFGLAHDQGRIDLHYFGGYWVLPKKSLEDSGSLTVINKCDAIDVVTCAADPKILETVQEELRKPIIRFYKRMLTNYTSRESKF